MRGESLLNRKKGRYQASTTSQRGKFLLPVLLAVLLIAVGVLFSGTAQDPPVPEETVEKLEGAASIPGFESLNLKAGTKKQTLVLSNPAENTCLFRLSLILEDGTVLWTSRYIHPGEDSDPIKLSKPLEAGSYKNTTLKYECFTQNKTPLNGAEIILTLRVKE